MPTTSWVCIPTRHDPRRGFLYYYEREWLTIVGLTLGLALKLGSVTTSGGSAQPPDTTAPAKPTNLQATAGDGQVVLTWTDPADSDLAGIQVIRRAAGIGSGSTITTIDPGIETYTDNGVNNGTKYYYSLVAIDEVPNSSAPTSEVSAAPAADVVAPTATLDSHFVIAGNASSTLHWPTDSIPEGATGVKVERKTTGSYSTVTTATAGDGSYQDSGLSNGTTYTYRLSWANSAGAGPTSTEIICVPWDEWKPLRGDPDFVESGLATAGRVWMDRITPFFSDPDTLYCYSSNFDPNDLYSLGRYFARPVLEGIAALRMTGDLRFLDLADYGMELARAELADQGVTGEGGGDGYLNWVELGDITPEDPYYNRDIHVMDEMMTHGMVAAYAWACQQNRDLTSPGGVNYGERADFWLSYLKNNFEPKWRARNSEPTDVPFLGPRGILHPDIRFGLAFSWNYWRLTGDVRYKTYADTVYDDWRNDVVAVDDKDIWPLGSNTLAGHVRGEADEVFWDLHNTGYVQYMAMDLFNAKCDGNAKVTDTHLQRITNSVNAYILDNGTTDVSSSIGGDGSLGGLNDNEEARNTAGQYYIGMIHWLSHWDDTGKIQSMAERFWNEQHTGDLDISASAALLTAYQLGDLPVPWGLGVTQDGSDAALSWTLPAYGSYSAWDHVVVYEGDESGSLTELAELGPTATGYTHTSPSTGTHYYAIAIRTGSETGFKSSEASLAVSSDVVLSLDLSVDSDGVGVYGATFSSFDDSGPARFIGDGNRTCYRYELNVPQNATIVEATFSLQAGNTTPAVSVDLSAVKSDDAAAPTSAEEVNANIGNLTTASVTWAVDALEDDETATSPDIKTVIQEVVNRAGWSSGNHILLYATPTSGGPEAQAQMKTIAGGFAPHLDVTYTP